MASAGTRRRTAFGLALAVQLVVLYAPRASDPAPGLPIDKVVHMVIFGAVAWTGLRAGIRPRWIVGALLAHAVVSEVVQYLFLPQRTGDWADSAADAAGTLLAAWLVLRVRGRVRGRGGATGGGIAASADGRDSSCR